MNNNKLNNNQINELYNYLLELTKNEGISMTMDEFLIFIEKSYKCIEEVSNEELYSVIKESIDRVVNTFEQGE